jgi:hypothetical protein
MLYRIAEVMNDQWIAEMDCRNGLPKQIAEVMMCVVLCVRGGCDGCDGCD